MFETAVVNEQSVVEPLKFYCKYKLGRSDCQIHDYSSDVAKTETENAKNTQWVLSHIPCHGKCVLYSIVTNSEDSDQPAQMRRLIRVFPVCLNSLLILRTISGAKWGRSGS